MSGDMRCRCTPDGTEPQCPIHKPGMDISERDPQPTPMSAWEVSQRTTFALCCAECGSPWRGSWKPFPQAAEKDRAQAERHPCKVCENRAKVAALPAHHAHHEHNPDWPYRGDLSAHCCAGVQLGIVDPYECAECGEPFPCAASLPTPTEQEKP